MSAVATWGRGVSREAHLSFVTVREARWAERALALDAAFNASVTRWPNIELDSSIRSTTWSLSLDARRPDSYSEELERMEADPDGWDAMIVRQLDDAVPVLSARLTAAGLAPLAAGRPAPAVEPCTAAGEALRVDRARPMPPTRRRTRRARTVTTIAADGVVSFDDGARTDATTVFPDVTAEEGRALPGPASLIVGETYWTTGDGALVATVDVAAVPASTLAIVAPVYAELAALGLDTDLVPPDAFLARELQYGPIDLRAARRRLSALLLERSHSLTATAEVPALANSLAVIVALVVPNADLRALLPRAESVDATFARANVLLASARAAYAPLARDPSVWTLRAT